MHVEFISRLIFILHLCVASSL